MNEAQTCGEILYNEKFHQQIDESEAVQAELLALWIKDRLRHLWTEVHVDDIGASRGLYVRKLLAMGISAKGYDKFTEYEPLVTRCDITQPMTLESGIGWGKKFFVTLCLEVFEHVEDVHWERMILNLIQRANVVIFSAALLGQGGTGHINCRSRYEWIRRFAMMGWMLDLDSTEHLVAFLSKNPGVMGWLKANVMIFVRVQRPDVLFCKSYVVE